MFSFTWGGEFTQYNMSIRREPLALGSTARSWDATARWAQLLDSPIARVNATWLPNGAGENTTEYPQSVHVVFASGAPVTISAFESGNAQLNMGMTDHITVFFDDADVKRLGV